ncbi:pectinesterase family protein [Phytohabitans rumicis]|uniref:Uncharacterized protein n=1 Tax=Phytohabitans rumicis TaxID=1076125 RepID=A0A6V8KWX7_9ACTN|nr:pectinesterase family protein [Phytohabitans rumicis]GFJ87178.1 hypothetical protein Prum_008200 [Phytohabitans rumicis]
MSESKHRRPKLRRSTRWQAAIALAVAVPGTVIGISMLSSQAATAPAAGAVYQLAVTKSGLCVDVVSGAKTSGAKLQQWGCASGATWQQFRLVTAGANRYRLVNLNSGMCVDVPGGSTASGVQLQQWGCGDGQANQTWTLTPSGSGTFQIVNVGSGLCVSDKGASVTSGTAIIQETCTANTNKQWAFKPVAGSTTVAADGTGRYKTVQAAIDAVPANNASRVTITIKPGTYREIVTVPANKPYITLQGTGDSADDVVIVNNHHAGAYGTSNSATAFVHGHDFVAANLSISNDFDEASVDSGHQAVALHLSADRATLSNVRLLGDQDTFLVNDGARAYIVNSYVEGTVDFVFGGGTAVFDNSEIHEKARGGSLTAASTAATKTYGFLFYKSRITADAANGSSYLGRPWRADAQVVYRESSLSAAIRTGQPWTDMSSNTWQAARFSEYKNTGAGAGVNGNRPQLTDAQAANHTPQKYLAGADGWNPVGSTVGSAPTTSARTWSSTADGFASTDGGTTGGASGQTVTVTTQADLVKYATASAAYVIKVGAAITISPKGTEIRVASNKTIIGVGTKGEIVGGGFFLGSGVNNVIIRNLTIRDTRMADDDPDDKEYDYDGIQMDGAHHVWIDHNTITRMNDGLIDSRKDTSYLTVSWNILSENNKAFGIGWTDNVTARMTIHHNWIHDNKQRNPSTDNVAYAHLYNNYLQNLTSYGNYARGATKMVIENSYYENVANPFYPDSAAQLKQSGSVVINCTGKQQTNGSAFDPAAFYSFAVDPAKDVPTLLKTYAGPQPNIGA